MSAAVSTSDFKWKYSTLQKWERQPRFVLWWRQNNVP